MSNWKVFFYSVGCFFVWKGVIFKVKWKSIAILSERHELPSFSRTKKLCPRPFRSSVFSSTRDTFFFNFIFSKGINAIVVLPISLIFLPKKSKLAIKLIYKYFYCVNSQRSRAVNWFLKNETFFVRGWGMGYFRLPLNFGTYSYIWKISLSEQQFLFDFIYSLNSCLWIIYWKR